MRSRLIVSLVAVAGIVGLVLLVSGGRLGSGDPSSGEHAATGHGDDAAAIASHVHGIARHPDTGSVLVATHEGLVEIPSSGAARSVGPNVDLMGFTVTPSGDLLASGHPGVGTDLPQPMGLIESTDGGQSWSVLSRGGESDFHTLASSTTGVVGFDGAVRVSPDGRSWQAAPPVPGVIALAVSPDGDTVLATTQAGLRTSAEGTGAWSEVTDAPTLVQVDWAGDSRVVGADPRGAVFLSSDSGQTWSQVAAPALGPLQALGAGLVDGELEILAVTRTAILRSGDGGASFAPLAPSS